MKGAEKAGEGLRGSPSSCRPCLPLHLPVEPPCSLPGDGLNALSLPGRDIPLPFPPAPHPPWQPCCIPRPFFLPAQPSSPPAPAQRGGVLGIRGAFSRGFPPYAGSVSLFLIGLRSRWRPSAS